MELGKINEVTDHRDADFQRILDIKPTKVIELEQDSKYTPISSEDNNDNGRQKDNLPKDVFEYFRLPSPDCCDKGILADIQEISFRIHSEAEDNDEFFLLLQSIERSLPENDDPVHRVRQILYFLRNIGHGIKDRLKDIGSLNMDILLEEAKDTGNFGRYLREAEARDAKIRNNS